MSTTPKTGVVHVMVRCPSCRHEWHCATIDYGTWWGKDCDPEKTRHRVYCVSCNQPPPMTLVGEQLDLLTT